VSEKAYGEDRLAPLTDEDFRKTEEFIQLMSVLFTSTLCVSTEKTAPHAARSSQFFRSWRSTVEEGDTVFVCKLKQAVWGNLSKWYQSDGIRHFLEEATALDPRFKHRMEDRTVWDRVKERLMVGKLTESEQPTEHAHGEDGVTMQSEEKRQRENEEGEERVRKRRSSDLPVRGL